MGGTQTNIGTSGLVNGLQSFKALDVRVDSTREGIALDWGFCLGVWILIDVRARAIEWLTVWHALTELLWNRPWGFPIIQKA